MSTAPSPLRVAVIGGGFIGKRHCSHVASNTSTKLVALVDSNPAAAHIAESHATSFYPYLTALLDSAEKPEAAIVCTPNHTHVPLSIQLAEAGVQHILCEKPISTSVDSAQDLIDVVQQLHVTLLIGHHRRFNPYMLATKKALEDGLVGQVTAVSCLWTAMKPAEYFAGEALAWRSSKSHGGGPVLNNLIHEIDLMHYLFGPITRIHAEKTISRRGQAADTVEEGAVLTVRFRSGVVGTFVLSDNVASPHSFEGGTGENPALPKTGADVYRVFGTEGTLSVPDMTLSTYAKGQASWQQDLIVHRLEVENVHVAPLDSQLEHFVRVCRGTEMPSCTGSQGLQALQVCEAIRTALDMPGGGGTVVVDGVTPK